MIDDQDIIDTSRIRESNLKPSLRQPRSNARIRFCTAASEPVLEDLEARRRNEGAAHGKMLTSISDVLDSIHVDVQYHYLLFALLV